MRWVAEKVLLFSLFLAGSLHAVALCKRLRLPGAELSSAVRCLHPRCGPPSWCGPARLGAPTGPSLEAGMGVGTAGAPGMQRQDTQGVRKE